MKLELTQNYDFLVCYNSLDRIEERFFNNMMLLIINYPIVWYNFVENILKNKLMISFRNTALIVSLELLTPQQRNAFKHVYQVMIDNNVILKSVEKKGFLIIYVYSQKISDFFQNSGFWLEYLTAYACFEIGFTSYRGVLLKTKDKSVQEVDVLIDLEKIIFLIECKDTYNYTDNDLKRIYDIRKKIKCCSHGIFVVSKLGFNINYAKYEIDLVRYKYDYLDFKNQLREVISNKIVSLSF